jgi:mono/diheme cytochrome c family protein
MQTRWLGLVVAGLALALPSGRAFAQDTLSTEAQHAISEGRKVFHGNGGCFACHGAKLQGGPIAPPLTGPKWLHVDGSLNEILNRIRTGMPGSVMIANPGGIGDDESFYVANYIWAVSQGKAKP